MADPKFDPASHAAQAQQLAALATKAREALRADTVERTSRLGQQRDDAARRAHGAEQEAAATVQQVKRELANAEKLDDEAAFRKALDDVSALIDTPTLGELYKQVSVDKKDIADVARDFLKAKGVVSS